MLRLDIGLAIGNGSAAALGRTAGGASDGGSGSTAAPLAALAITTNRATAGAAFTAAILGTSPGSTVTATSDDDTVLDVSGTTVSGRFTAVGSPTIRLSEALAGAPGSPRTSVCRLAVTPPATLAYLPALTTSGASYHGVYSNERLIESYTGDLAFVNLAAGTSGGIDIGAGATGLTAADLPAGVTPLYGWYDQTGNGRNPVQDTLALRPHLRAEVTIGSRLAAAFGGRANLAAQRATLTGPQALTSNDRSDVFVIHPMVTRQAAIYAEHTASSGAVLRDIGTDNSDHGLYAAQAYRTPRMSATPQVLILADGADGATLFLYGVNYPGPAGSIANGTITSLLLGGQASGDAFNANMRLGAYVSISGAIDDADAAAITSALQARFGIAADHALNLVHIGDSIVEGQQDEDTIGFGPQLLPLINVATRYWNLGISGKTLAQCYADRDGVEPAIVDSGAINIALIDAGINDLGEGAAGASLYADTATPYAAYLQGLGYRVGIVTLLPQASGSYATSDAAIEAQRQAYNGAALANGARADFIVDRAAESHMGAYPSSCLDDTLYAAEAPAALHPTTRGYAYLAIVYAAAINGLL